jgi:hypothetical protein
MLRLLIVFVAAVSLVVSLAGCGGGEGDATEEHTAHTPDAATDVQGRPMIPPASEDAGPVEGVYTNLYFDEAGTITELAVAPGETFDLYLFAEYPKPYIVASAEYRLVLPQGVTIFGHEMFRDRCLTMGTYKKDFAITFECDTPTPGKFYIMKYACRAESDFQGGEIRAAEGVNDKGKGFLGFIACEEPQLRRLRSKGGVATLTMK